MLTGDYEKDHAMMAAMMDDGEDMMINQPRTKNEIDPNSIPVEPVARAPVASLVQLGLVFSLLDRTLVIKTPGAGLSDSDSDDEDNNAQSHSSSSSSGVQHEALDVGTGVFLADGAPVGRIDDIIGAIECPFYVVRQAAELGVVYPYTAAPTEGAAEASDEATPAEPTTPALAGSPLLTQLQLPSLKTLIAPYTPLFFQRGAAHVSKAQLHVPGSDASNLFDEEVGEDQQEFSDDEQEQAHRKMKTQQLQAARAAAGLPVKTKNKGKNAPNQPQQQQKPVHPPLPPPPPSWKPQQQPQAQMQMHSGMFLPPPPPPRK
jgi:hypothetical protein